jgi:hypothetical protein
MSLEKFLFGIVGLYESVYSHDFKDAAHLVFFGDDEHRAFVLLHVAQAVNEQADSSAVKERRPLEVEHKMVVALPDQSRNLVIKDFRASGAVYVPDDMDHREPAAIFYFIFHEKSSAVYAVGCPASDK